MATKYPTSPDNDSTLPRVDDNLTEVGGEAINALREAVLALERAVGSNPQGNVADLVTRINQVIDPNGVIKTSALSGKGLVTLPIDDAQIASDAAIKESKLDLDYSTASLNTTVAGLDADVASISAATGALASDYLAHVAGTADQHEASKVIVTPTVRSEADVQAALEAIDAAVVAHEADVTAHMATSIPVVNEFLHFSATNVQTALFELDVAGSGAVSDHHLEEHDTGIGFSSRFESGSHFNLRETTMAATIAETNTVDATNILQVMRPNVARVTGGPINFQALDAATARLIRIYAGGARAAYIDISLSGVIPTNSLDTIVQAINQEAMNSRHPVAAYNTNGRLTIAHNIPGQLHTIMISALSGNSAVDALGFADVAEQTVYWPGNECQAFPGGRKITDFAPIYRGTITLAVNSDDIETTEDLSLSGLTIGNQGRVLVHITGHNGVGALSGNGTYHIKSFLSNSRFLLHQQVEAGTFDVEIVKDSLNFDNSAAGSVWDLFVDYDADGYGQVSKDLRLSYQNIPNVSIASVNESFPETSVEWQILDAGRLSLVEGGLSGEEVLINPGYIGPVRARSYNGVGEAIFQVNGNPGTGTEAVTVLPFAGSYDRVYLGSVHHSGNFGTNELKYVTDKRQLGTTIENQLSDPFNPSALEHSLDDLRNNGVVYGLERLDSSTDTITISGGRAYVSGRRLDVPTTILSVTDFTLPSGMVVLDASGNLVVHSTLDTGFSFAELTAGDAYGDLVNVAPILEFGTTGTAFDGVFSDRRFQIGNLDRRLLDQTTNIHSRIDTLQSVIGGSLWGFTVGFKDGAAGNIQLASNTGFTSIDSDDGFYTTPAVTTRRFEFTDTGIVKTSLFKATGTTHLNVFMQLEYTDNSGSKPFGTSGDALIYGGARITVGGNVYEDYALLKEISTTVMPANSVVERYVVSIPFTALINTNPLFLDVTPTLKVVNSTIIDGGTGGGAAPKLNASDVRVVLSSYSIAGDLNQDATNESQMAYVGNVL